MQYSKYKNYLPWSFHNSEWISTYIAYVSKNVDGELICPRPYKEMEPADNIFYESSNFFFILKYVQLLNPLI